MPSLKHAMILAAGLGTRLKPLTDKKPKALVELNGVPLLEILITRLIRYGIQSFTVNIHHYPEQVRTFLEENNNFGVSITVSDESDALLDSGGGIKKASSLFPAGEDVLVHNVDILTNLDINAMYDFHQKNQAWASLAVRNRKTQRYYIFDNKKQLIGWTNTSTGEQVGVRGKEKPSRNLLAFSGISILSPEFIRSMHLSGAYPIRDVFLRLASSNKILSYIHDGDYWIDLGKPMHMAEATMFLKNSQFPL